MADVEIDFDPSDLRVNFSEEEASSEARSFEPVPSGKYHCAITDGEIAYSNSAKNPGKPYWKLTLTAQSGPYEGKKFWANVMLFEGALYTLAQLMKAIGREDVLKSGQIPDLEESIIGQELTAVVKKVKDQYQMDKSEDDTIIWKNEVSGFKALAGSGSNASSSSSLLP